MRLVRDTRLELVGDPQTDAAVEKFTQDWQRVKKQYNEVPPLLVAHDPL